MSLSQLCSGCLVVLLILGFGAPVQPESNKTIPKAGDRLAEISLPLPIAPEQRAYLGLAPMAAGNFTLATTAADLVLVQIFSMYCPHCQREAPTVNQLFTALQKRPESAPRIRLLGIGVGNTPMEVDVFRKTYGIAFPLFPDGDFTVHKQLGEVRTPFFFAFRPGDAEPLRLCLAHLGPFEDVDGFVDRLNTLAMKKAP